MAQVGMSVGMECDGMGKEVNGMASFLGSILMGFFLLFPQSTLPFAPLLCV